MSHVGYITPAHTEAVRAFGPSQLHRRSFDARCYADPAWDELEQVPAVASLDAA
jgi:ribonuclease HII